MKTTTLLIASMFLLGASTCNESPEALAAKVTCIQICADGRAAYRDGEAGIIEVESKTYSCECTYRVSSDIERVK